MGYWLTGSLMLAVIGYGVFAEKYRVYEPVTIYAPAVPKRIKPAPAPGDEQEPDAFAIHSLHAGAPVPEGMDRIRLAPTQSGLSELDLSPRARRELARLNGERDPDAGTGGRAGPGRAELAMLVWNSHLAARDRGPEQLEEGSIAAGSYVAQLADYPTESEAMIEWSRLRDLYPDLLNGVDWYLEDARSGGRDIVRLRVAGFGARELQQYFCSRLEAEFETCIPTVIR